MGMVTGEDRHKLCEHCDESFVAMRPFQRFCTPRCQGAAWKDRNYERSLELDRNRYQRDKEERLVALKEYAARQDPEAQRAWRREWQKTPKGLERGRRSAAAYRACHRGLEGSHTFAEWDELVEECGCVCVQCRRGERPLERDHIVPISRGGSNYIWNIQPLCKPCNVGKSNKWVSASSNLAGRDRQVAHGSLSQER